MRKTTPKTLSSLFAYLVVVSTQALAGASSMEGRAMEFQSDEIRTGSGMMEEYGAAGTRPLSLPEFSDAEESEILGLIQDERRFYTGIRRAAPVADGNWASVGEEDGFVVWQLHIHSPHALSLQIDFSEFRLPEGWSVKVYGADGGEAPYIGEYTGRGPIAMGDFSSLAIPGDTVVVEAWVPENMNAAPADFPFSITHVWHQFRDDTNNIRGVKSFRRSDAQPHGNCPLDNVDRDRCTFEGSTFQPWRSVGRMTVQGASCSGTLLNNRMGDGLALFLTAYHCIENVVNAEAAAGTPVNASFVFGESSCAPGGRAIGAAGAARFIAGNVRGDYALLYIPTVASSDDLVLLGWNPAVLRAGNTLDVFHHALSMEQQYLRSEITGFEALQAGPGNRVGTIFFSCSGADCSHYDLHSVLGGAGPGSSGGGWFTREHALNAVLTHADGDTCTQSGSLFNKIYGDGRVRCALEEGSAYVVDGSACPDSARPTYLAVSGGGGGGGGGGGTGPWLIALLAAFLAGRAGARP